MAYCLLPPFNGQDFLECKPILRVLNEDTVKAWRNWPTLLAKHFRFPLKSGITFLSIANISETNKCLPSNVGQFRQGLSLSFITIFHVLFNYSKDTVECNMEYIGQMVWLHFVQYASLIDQYF